MSEQNSKRADAKPKLAFQKRMASVKDWFLDRDRFPSPITVNFNRKSAIPTAPGVIITFILYLTVLMYAFQKANQLLYRKGPTITPELSKNFYSSKDEINLDEVGFKLAFGVMDYSDRSIANNDSFVEWNIYLETRLNLKVIDTVKVPYHRCTPDDYDSFYTI